MFYITYPAHTNTRQRIKLMVHLAQQRIAKQNEMLTIHAGFITADA